MIDYFYSTLYMFYLQHFISNHNHTKGLSVKTNVQTNDDLSSINQMYPHHYMFMRRNNNTSTFFKAFFFFSYSSSYEGARTLCHVFEESSSHDMLSTRQYYGVVMMMKVCFKQGRCEWCRLLPTKASPRGCVHFISELNGRVDGCTGDCTEDRGDQVNPYAVIVAGSNSRPQRPYRVHGSTSARPDHIYHQVQILKFLF